MQRFCVSVFSLLVSIAGCSQLNPGFGSSQERSGFDIAELVDLRLRIPDRPAPPPPPKVVSAAPETVANRAPTFSGTLRGVLAQTSVVAVISNSLVVGGESTAGKYAGDLLYLALQRRSVGLLDRDYRAAKREELADASGETPLFRLSDNERNALIRDDREATHLVFVHHLPIMGNPLALPLPWTVAEEEWHEYEISRDGYLASAEAYNSAVTAFDEKCREEARKLARNRERIIDSKEGNLNRELTVLDQIRDAVERSARIRDRELARLASCSGTGAAGNLLRSTSNELQSPMPGRFMGGFLSALPFGRPGSDRLGGPSPEQASITPAGTVRSGLSDLQVICPTEILVYRSKEELVATWNTYSAPHVLAFQAGCSVRVVELSTGKAVWFGYASGQHMDFVTAMGDAAEALAGGLTGQ